MPIWFPIAARREAPPDVCGAPKFPPGPSLENSARWRPRPETKLVHPCRDMPCRDPSGGLRREKVWRRAHQGRCERSSERILLVVAGPVAWLAYNLDGSPTD